MNRAEIKIRQVRELSNILALITVLLLGRLIGDNGVTYVIVAMEVYGLMWSVAGKNISDTLGKQLRGRRNKGQQKNAAQMRRSALIFQLIAGAAGSLLLFLLAETIAGGIFKVQYSTLLIKVLSPMVLLRSVSSVLLGYFQGEGSEFPTMVSDVLRRILILGFGILFSQILSGYGEKVSTLLMQSNFTAMYGGVGFAIAVNLAEILIILFLVVIYRGMCRSDKKSKQDAPFSAAGIFDCIRTLVLGRWPEGVMGILGVLPVLLGILFIDTSVSEETGILEYGVFAGKYLVLCGIVIALLSFITLPVIARIYAGVRREEHKHVKMVFQSGVHIGVVHGIFASVMAAVMGRPFGELLCPENADLLRKMLLEGSSVIAFLSLALYFGRILQTGGKKVLLLGTAGIADVVFIIMALILSTVGKAGIMSLIYGGMISMFVLCVLLGMLSYAQMRTRMDWLNVLLVPLGAGSAAGLTGALLVRLLSPHLNALLIIFLACGIAGIVYWVILLVLRNFKEQELDVILGGRLLGTIGEMLHVY